MNRREAILSALLVFGIALVARVVFASQIVFPKPEDTAYYVGVARNLVEGRGLVSDALWSFQTPPLIFPRPAFEVWLPLPTYVAALPMAVWGTTFASAQVSSVLVGSIVPVLAWRLAADVAAERGMSTLRASDIGLPVFRDSCSASRSMFASIRSASLKSTRARSAAPIALHSGNAALAARTAASTSRRSESGTRAKTLPVAGSTTSAYVPPCGPTIFPPMKFESVSMGNGKWHVSPVSCRRMLSQRRREHRGRRGMEG